MVLEVEGSNPSIYPIIKLNLKFNFNKTLKIKWFLFLLKFLKYTYSFNKSFITPDLLYFYFFKKNKFNYKVKSLFNTLTPILSKNIKKQKIQNFNLNSKPFLTNFLIFFLKINNFYVYSDYIIHFSWKFWFLNNSKNLINLYFLKKIFNKWKNIFLLFINIFYYNISLLTFGTNFLKKEILSFNWFYLNKFFLKWKLIFPFFFLKLNKIFNYGNYIFLNLKLKGFNLVLLLDILYHNKTNFYLKLNNFYVISLVPLYFNMLSVNFAIPINNNSVLNHLIFFKFLLKLKRISKKLEYQNVKNLWYK